MKKPLMMFALLAALAAPAFAHADDTYKAGALTISEPWARASAGDNGAAFMTITAEGSANDRLVGASSPVATTVELHTHIMEGDIMRMRPVQDIPVVGGTPTVLKPGGLHVMLIGLKHPLVEGQEFPLTLTFEKAGTVTVEVDVESKAAAAPADMGEHMHKQ